MRPLRVVQITDCHLGSQPGELMLGLDTDQSLFDVLELIQNSEPTPDLILATGDISNDGGAASYQRFIDIVNHYFPGVALAWLPGNHDDPLNMDQVDILPIEAHYRAQGWNLILLDSRIPMEEGGELHPNELMRLDAELKANSEPTMVFLHHQPVPVGSEWIDQYVVKNAEAFFDVLDKYDHVKAVSWGHVHQEFQDSRNNVTLLAPPSTCVQFAPKSKPFKLDTIMPGYRSYSLNADGSFTSEVKRIQTKAYAIDFASTGY